DADNVIHAGNYGGFLTNAELIDGFQFGVIIVAARKVIKQVANGEDFQFGQVLDLVVTHAPDNVHGGIKSDLGLAGSGWWYRLTTTSRLCGWRCPSWCRRSLQRIYDRLRNGLRIWFAARSRRKTADLA